MNIELRPLVGIKPYEKNPRINDAAVDAVAESIRRFGFRQPIVVDGDGVIVCGHTRYRAAQKLGLPEVPVHVATDLTPEQIRAYRIADNKTAELADWNLDLLPIELAELKDAGIDWSLLGFDADELAIMLDPGVKQGLTDPDDVPAPPDAAVTQTGDLWVLGDHRLLCGDSSSAADVNRLLDGAAIHLVNTDPPYNVRVEPRSNNAIAAGLRSFESGAAPTAGCPDGRGRRFGANAEHLSADAAIGGRSSSRRPDARINRVVSTSCDTCPPLCCTQTGSSPRAGPLPPKKSSGTPKKACGLRGGGYGIMAVWNRRRSTL